MNIHIGTSAYSIKEWKGKFYPEDLPQKQMLRFYGERFNTVEINNTFYRIPAVSMLEGWKSEVPETFKFAIKVPQQISHYQRLINSNESVQRLLSVIEVLGSRLGPLLIQLPPNFKKDLPRLQSFLDLLPQSCQAAFEFRHPSWFEDEVFETLRAHSAALCIAEDVGELHVPVAATTSWGYLRLRRLDYSDAMLKQWAATLWEQPWTDAFVFFKHEDQALGPKFATRFAKIIQAVN